MTDLHGWITQQVDRAEAVAREAADGDSGQWFVGRKWNVYRAEDQTPNEDDETNALVVYGNMQAQSEHIALNDPAAVLRRCEADRRILNRHTLDLEYWYDPACKGCRTYGLDEMAYTDNLNECPELLDLAHAHGLTDEILAGLDQPQAPPRPQPKPLGGILPPGTGATADVPPALRGPNWRAR